MPYGCNIATCLHCHKRWTVGDGIPSICNECRQAGHKGMPFFALDLAGEDACPICKADRERMLADARAASDAAKQKQLAADAASEEMHRQRPWPGRKATGFRKGW